jgi:hypothetical protein
MAQTFSIEVLRATYSEIAEFRKEFLRETKIQFVLDKAYRYRWADTYVLNVASRAVGYGSVWGKEKREDRDAIFEFFLLTEARHLSEEFFTTFCKASKAKYIECQTNDKFLYPLFEKFAADIQTDAILFADDHETDLNFPDLTLIPRINPNADDCQYVLMQTGLDVGEGGFMLNYNFPFADIYYSIKESHRGRGYGSYFVQELKREVYKNGRVPSARCNANNAISKATLLKAGMAVCGARVTGSLNFL